MPTKAKQRRKTGPPTRGPTVKEPNALLMDVGDVAAYLGRGEFAVRGMIRRREIPRTRTDGCV